MIYLSIKGHILIHLPKQKIFVVCINFFGHRFVQIQPKFKRCGLNK